MLIYSKLDSYSKLNLKKAVVTNDRTFRLIEPTKRQSLPRNIVFYDIETNPTTTSKGVKTHFFKLGFMVHTELSKSGTVVNRTEYVQHKEEDVYNDLLEILKGRNKIIVFAHNQNYDFVASNMLFYFTQNGWEIEMFNPESKAFLVKFTRKHKTVFFLDTLNFFAGSAEALGESLKIPKLKMPKIISRYENELIKSDYDLDKVSDRCYKYYDAWLTYNKRDVEIIEKAVLNLIDFLVENEYGSLSYTIASLAYSIFKHKFMKTQLKVHTNIDALTLERASYYGGRTEIFYQGTLPRKNYYILDVTSMYPFVMRNFKFPTTLIGKITNDNVDNVIKKSEKYGVIANVDIKTDINCIPKRYNDKLTFPIGEFNTTLAHPELKLALDKGLIKNVNAGYVYHMDYIFKEYVDAFFKLKNENKQAGNTIYAYFYKILLNSLYGKFAQRVSQYVDTGLKSKFQFASGFLSDEIKDEQYYTKTIDYTVYKILKDIEVNFSMPSISSFVTSYARVHLWHMMSAAGHKNYFYCDTDSLFVDRVGYNNLKKFIKDNNLGFLELQNTSRSVDIRTVKDYTFGKKVKRKGVPGKFTEIEQNVFRGDKFSRVNDIFVNEDFFKMQTKETSKVLSGIYNKGIVHHNGVVSPWILVKNLC